MALTNAARQARWQAKRKALEQSLPDQIEQALLQDVERCARGELSVEECAAVADQLADAANRHLRRSHELAAIATKMTTPMVRHLPQVFRFRPAFSSPLPTSGPARFAVRIRVVRQPCH